MEDMVESFAARLTLTSEEQMVVVVDDKECAFRRMTKVFLVGRVLSPKPVVKERFKRQMMHLWRPKAKVTIVDLDDDLFSFSFETKCERVMVLKGDIKKPFRRSLLLSIEGAMVSVNLRYEKMLITCFLCGIVGYLEEQCGLFKGKNEEDMSKSYGRWFQNDILDTNYCRTQGTRYGLDSGRGWSMKAPGGVENDDDVSAFYVIKGMKTDMIRVMATGGKGSRDGARGSVQDYMSNNDRIDLPDLNEVVNHDEMLIDDFEIIPFNGHPNGTDLEAGLHEEVNVRCLRLFGVDLNDSSAGNEVHPRVELPQLVFQHKASLSRKQVTVAARAQEFGTFEIELGKQAEREGEDDVTPLRGFYALQQLIFSKDPIIVFLCETKSNVRYMERLWVKFNYDHSFTVDSRGNSGGLCVFWKEEIDLRLQSYSQHHINFDVNALRGACCWRLTGFHGYPAMSDRVKSGQLLDNLYGDATYSWLCVGDFKEVLQANEHEGGNLRSERQMEGFRNIVEKCQLNDLGYSVFSMCFIKLWRTNRLKLILPRIISPTQSAFIPGRLISDNYLVAAEVTHYMHKRALGMHRLMALKLDISKVYDRVEWKFLEAMMGRLGFSPNWIHMIMLCVSTLTYSCKLNGEPMGYGGFGAVQRDHIGEFAAAATGLLGWTGPAFHAKLCAAQQALLLAQAYCPAGKMISFEGDSSL
ncbi:hypothetical protein D8674_021305 [Pyrus ussuriensis x Pyrus communis]|uniref:Uncharacterized protein n=1 Tax=Pyrus ussuriensis x Pyrus communis TaxID=2448454 RepID=A0A5N5G9C5_9ROSA|nr:hypothetical protein D8674_036558 [Pyrus ussuriensis x Pyrus communis]KAB2614717.1 hypothetical protein D8674_021305 [Pyrus ussuriensis x Pyrus communis]